MRLTEISAEGFPSADLLSAIILILIAALLILIIVLILAVLLILVIILIVVLLRILILVLVVHDRFSFRSYGCTALIVYPQN